MTLANELSNGKSHAGKASDYSDKETFSGDLTNVQIAERKKMTLADEIEEAMNTRKFVDTGNYLSEKKLIALKQEDIVRLFKKAVILDYSKVSICLLLAINNDKLTSLSDIAGGNLLSFFCTS